MIDFAWVHSKASQSDKFALRWVPLATALNGCRQAVGVTLHAHNVGTYRPYKFYYLSAGDIAVMNLTTALTLPFAYLKRQLRPYMHAIRAYARGALPWVNLNHLATMPVRLVPDLAGKLAKPCIADCASEFVVRICRKITFPILCPIKLYVLGNRV